MTPPSFPFPMIKARYHEVLAKIICLRNDSQGPKIDRLVMEICLVSLGYFSPGVIYKVIKDFKLQKVLRPLKTSFL